MGEARPDRSGAFQPAEHGVIQRRVQDEFERRVHRSTMLLTGGGLALDPTDCLAAASLAVGKAGLRSLARSLPAELVPEGLRVGTVTIAGMIAPGTSFAPERIAEAFWRLHDSADPTSGKVVYSGAL